MSAAEPTARCRRRHGDCGTLFLFEKLTTTSSERLCREGRVERFEPGPVYAEGDPATCFYVLLEGTVVLSRRVGGDDVEVSRTSQRGVYAGAIQAYLGDRVPQVVQQLAAGDRAVAVLRAARGRRSPDVMRDWFPMAVHLLEGLFFGSQEHPAGHRPARAAAGARLAVRRAHPRAEQPGRGGRAGHADAARAGRRDAAQAGRDRRRALRRGPRWRRWSSCRSARPSRSPRPPALSPLEASDREDELADWLEDHGIAERLGARADLRAGRARHRLAGAGRGDRGRGRRSRARSLAELHRRDRAADERDRGLHHPHLHLVGRGQAVLAARPGALPGRRRARTARQHPADAVREDRPGHHGGQGVRPHPAARSRPTRRELNQVWTNLIDNAVAAMADGRRGHADRAHRARRATGCWSRSATPAPASRGDPRPDLRAVLHHQAGGRGHRARPGHLLADRRQQAPRRPPGRVRARRHPLPGAACRSPAAPTCRPTRPRGARHDHTAGIDPTVPAERHRLRRVRRRWAAGGSTCAAAPSAATSAAATPRPRQHATAHAAATGHPVDQQLRAGRGLVLELRHRRAVRVGPDLAAAGSATRRTSRCRAPRAGSRRLGGHAGLSTVPGRHPGGAAGRGSTVSWACYELSWKVERLIGIAGHRAAAERIAGHVVRTPTVPSPGLSALLGVPVTAKLELLQRTGSFKARGAAAKLLALSEAERAAGVVAVSGGNHGIALAVTWPPRWT